MSEFQLPSPDDESTDLTPLLSDVFISYSHVDERFVNRLVEALKAANRIIWVDRRKIPPAADWQQKIYSGIETASSFVFVLSPDSIISEPCLKESRHANLNRKRIIPLVYRMVDYQNVPEELQIPQWILFTQDEPFDSAFKKLLYALETDQAYWNEATRLLTYAKEWERQGKDQSSLLRGRALKEAEQLLQAGATKIPGPAPIVMDFIQASREQRKRITRRTMLGSLAGSLVGVAALITIGVLVERPPHVITKTRSLITTRITLKPARNLPYSYTGHTSGVQSVAWSPDEKYLASASLDDTVQIWDASSGTTLFSYTNHIGGVLCAAWSPDGKRIASANTTVQVWNANSLTAIPPLLTYTGHTGDVYSVAWSPDGKYLASASLDGTVQVWNASSGARLLTYKGHTSGVQSVAWSPDGKYLASASADTTVQVWNASSGARLLTYTGHTDVLQSWVYSANGYYFTKGVWSVAWSPNGKYLASASVDKTVQVWVANSGIRLLTYTGHTDVVWSAAWSPDGKYLASASADTTVQVASSGTSPLTYKGHTGDVYSVAWSPDGRYLASASGDETVQVWDASSGARLLTYTGHISVVGSVAWSPDGKYLASASADTTVQVWSASSGTTLFTYKGHTGAVNSVAWSPDGKRIASAGGDGDGTVQVWNAGSGAHLLTYTGQSLITYTGSTIGVLSVAWSPDGNRIASPGVDGTVQVWDANSGKHLLTYTGHIMIQGRVIPDINTTVSTVVWSPDGKHLASASDGFDETVHVWDASSGTRLLAYTGHTDVVLSIAWSPDGKYLASASVDTTVQVWSASSGTTLFTYRGHTDAVNSVAWSPDEKHIASASNDDTAQVWFIL